MFAEKLHALYRPGINQGWAGIHSKVEVRDSRTGYLIPARDGTGALPDMESSWDVAAVAAAAVSCQNVTLISFSFRA